jgi:hypothetical protein
MKKMPFRYDCVYGPVKELTYIDDHEISITWRTFRKYIDMEWLTEWMEYMGYNKHLRLWNDRSVSYGRSKLPDGRWVYIMYWSGIHLVFYHDKKTS